MIEIGAHFMIILVYHSLRRIMHNLPFLVIYFYVALYLSSFLGAVSGF